MTVGKSRNHQSRNDSAALVRANAIPNLETFNLPRLYIPIRMYGKNQFYKTFLILIQVDKKCVLEKEYGYTAINP